MHMTTSEAAKTTAELMTLGSRWRNRIRRGEAGHPRGLDELRVLEHQHLAAHQLGVAHPPHQPQGDEQVDQSLAQDGHDGDDQDGEGEGHHDIGDAHEQAVQEAAVVAGQQSDHAAHQKGNHHAQHADEQIDAGTQMTREKMSRP